MKCIRWQTLAFAMVLSIGVPIAGKWLRQDSAARCAFDGVKIENLFRVRVVDDGKVSRDFCCPRCAALWREEQHGARSSVFVTDEISGREFETELVHFVRSAVVTSSTTGNRIHVFHDRADAEKHALTADGRLLLESERPFLNAH